MNQIKSNFHLFLHVVDGVSSGHRGRRSSIGSLVCGAFVAMLNAIAPTTSHASLTSFTLRQCRYALALSIQFAAQLGVSLETYRTWDSGRRPVRPDVLARANELALRADPHALRPLETLARLIHVHVKRCRRPPETVASGSPMTHGRRFGVCARARPSVTPTPSYIRTLKRPRGRRIDPRP
jgi:hypothetical protein